MQDPDELGRLAFAALLRGDLKERDRLCALAINILNFRERVQHGMPPLASPGIVLDKTEEKDDGVQS